MQELIPVNIVIGDRTYRIRISKEDEESVRKTVKVVNDKIVDFKTLFAGKDMQDYIGMVLVWFATQSSAAQASEGVNSQLMNQLELLEKRVDEALVDSAP